MKHAKDVEKGAKSVNKLVVMSLILCLLTGCAEQRKEKTPVVQLAFWGDRWNRVLAASLVDSYNQTDPEVRVRYLPIEGQYEGKLLTMIAGGTPPDIILLNPSQLIDYASREILLGLDDFMENDSEFGELKKDIHPGLLEDGKYQDRIYGVPIWGNTMALFYNRDLFDEEGMSYPDETWDWEKVLTAAKRLTKDKDGDGRIDQFGLFGLEYTLGASYGWDLYLPIRGNNIELFSADGKRCLIEQPEVKEVIRWALDLRTKHHVIPTTAYMQTGQFGWGGGETFSTGRIGMCIGGRWFFGVYLDKVKFNWSVAPYPRGKSRVMTRGTLLLGASKKTKYPEACWKFMRYVISKNGQEYMIKDRSDISILISMGKTDAYLNYYSRPRENKLFLDTFSHAERYPPFSGQKEWNTETRRLFESVELGVIGLDEACRQIARKYEELKK